ncbi:MAG: shikimate kinase, partial [Leptolyngbyaceae cyanobacterium]
MQAAFFGQRISVVGTSGSGKTTLARQVSQRLQIPHFELDALYWEPNWGKPAEDIFRQRVSDALMGECW